MTSTPIEADDLSETFANDPGWKTKTYKLMKSWPKCHNPEATPEERKGVRDYWEEYWEIFQAEKAADRVPHIAANRFYRKHRKEMDDGAEVLNPHNFDPKTEVSGIQHAMNIMFRDGLDTFMSEYQMQPPRNAFAFEITAKLILSRIRRGVPAADVRIPRLPGAAQHGDGLQPRFGLRQCRKARDGRKLPPARVNAPAVYRDSLRLYLGGV